MNSSEYRPPFFLFNRHAETIFPSLLRKVELTAYTRERIPTPDQDFLDLDWLKQGSKKLIVLSHGLEGNSSRPYMKGMARIFYQNKFDVLAWNYRGCSDEMNRQLRFYHSGATDDLDTVLAHVRASGYQSIYLIGFSLGGNLTLKYLGEQSHHLASEIRGAVAFSVPIHLHHSCLEISKSHNWLYAQRFLTSLKEKVLRKATQFPELNTQGLMDVKTLIDFDNRYTSVLHGFKDAVDYYTKCSSIHFLQDIQRPTLLASAQNDPFLSPDCYPDNVSNKNITTDYPTFGGHVGFTLLNQNGLYWSELRALQFINSIDRG